MKKPTLKEVQDYFLITTGWEADKVTQDLKRGCFRIHIKGTKPIPSDNWSDDILPHVTSVVPAGRVAILDYCDLINPLVTGGYFKNLQALKGLEKGDKMQVTIYGPDSGEFRDQEMVFVCRDETNNILAMPYGEPTEIREDVLGFGDHYLIKADCPKRILDLITYYIPKAGMFETALGEPTYIEPITQPLHEYLKNQIR